MKDYIALISVGPASDKFHYVLDNKSMDTKTAMLHLIDTVGMSVDNAEDYLATLPEKWFHDMEAFLADPKAAISSESALAQ